MAGDATHRADAVVFAVATAQERQACRPVMETTTCTKRVRPVFLQTGIGPLDIDGIIGRLNTLRASALISIGTAGAIAPGVEAGTVLVPKRVCMPDGQTLETDPHWQAAVFTAVGLVMPVIEDDLLSVSALVRYPNEKLALHAETSAIAIDMESGQLAMAARQMALPFMVLRVVMDTRDDEIPGAARAAISNNGDTAVLALLYYLCRNPTQLGPMIRTARRFRRAARSLRKACESGEEALMRCK